MSSIQNIRVFDLGGSGLKTAVMAFDATKKTMAITSSEVQLGKCPDDMSVSDWVREKIKQLASSNLDTEITSGYRFGFSLAGLDKLRNKNVDGDIPELFDIPSDKVKFTNDGAAHLLASLKTLKYLPKGRIWNIAIGTGVGIGFTNSKKEIRPSKELRKFFGTHAWEAKEPTTGKGIWEVGSSKAFDKIVVDKNGKVEQAFDIFATRWKSFIKNKIIDRSKTSEKKWGAPSAIVFTGGHIDHQGETLVQKLKDLEIPVFAGPKNAGLFGAAWKAIER